MRRDSEGYSPRFANPLARRANCARIALLEVPPEPAQRRLLILRRPTLSIEMHELQRVLERQVRELASCVLCQPERSALDGSAETNVSGQERMFAALSSS